MDIERTGEIERRARIHGALADPTRLQVVDLLTLGDAASSELSARLDVPSNLLAHHLRILERAGLAERRPSEGDARRSYWRLVEHIFEPLTGPRITAPERVVFVCTANTARSQLAAALWREASAVPTTSAGTRPASRVAPGAAAAARRHGLDLAAVVPRHVDDVVADGDLVITVCDRAHEELGAGERLHWSTPDPVGVGTRDAFDLAYDLLAARVQRLAPILAAP